MYSADLTPEYGTETLRDHYAAWLAEGLITGGATVCKMARGGEGLVQFCGHEDRLPAA